MEVSTVISIYMTKGDCFDILQDFHTQVRSALRPFAQAIDELESSGKWCSEIYSTLQHFKTFHERKASAHTRDEEIAFYPILGQRWRESRPLETIHSPAEYMLREHSDINAHIHSIGVLADILQQQPANDVVVETLVGEARAILTILPMHMQKEEQFLFPQARELLPQEDIQKATILIQSLHQS